jgi:hypothetical protein
MFVDNRQLGLLKSLSKSKNRRSRLFQKPQKNWILYRGWSFDFSFSKMWEPWVMMNHVNWFFWCFRWTIGYMMNHVNWFFWCFRWTMGYMMNHVNWFFWCFRTMGYYEPCELILWCFRTMGYIWWTMWIGSFDVLEPWVIMNHVNWFFDVLDPWLMMNHVN